MREGYLMEYDDTRVVERLPKSRKGYDTLNAYAGADKVTINGDKVTLYGHKACGQVVFDTDAHDKICKAKK